MLELKFREGSRVALGRQSELERVVILLLGAPTTMSRRLPVA